MSGAASRGGKSRGRDGSISGGRWWTRSTAMLHVGWLVAGYEVGDGLDLDRREMILLVVTIERSSKDSGSASSAGRGKSSSPATHERNDSAARGGASSRDRRFRLPSLR